MEGFEVFVGREVKVVCLDVMSGDTFTQTGMFSKANSVGVIVLFNNNPVFIPWANVTGMTTQD